MSSSDTDDDVFNDFSKYKKKYRKRKKNNGSASDEPSFVSKSSNATKMETIEIAEAEEDDLSLEGLIEMQRKRKTADTTKASTSDFIPDLKNLISPVINSTPKKRQTRKKRPKTSVADLAILQPVVKNAAHYLADAVHTQQQMLQALRSEELELELLGNVPSPPTTLPKVIARLYITVTEDDDYGEFVDIKMNEMFQKVFLDSGAKAGFDDPNSIRLSWDNGEQFVNVRFYDTPARLGMDPAKITKIVITPKEGTERMKRLDGELMVKLRFKDEKHPIDMLIHKDTKFGEFKQKVCSRMRLQANKVYFRFDSDRIDDADTPSSLDMEDYDLLDVIVSA